MIDYFAIALTHGLMAYVAVRLLLRDDLDSDAAAIEAADKIAERARKKARPGAGKRRRTRPDA